MPFTPPTPEELAIRVDEWIEENTQESALTLLGVYHETDTPRELKRKIAEHLNKEWDNFFVEPEDRKDSDVVEWEERWHRRARMRRKADDFMDPLNPVFLQNYFTNMRKILGRNPELHGRNDEELNQDAFVALIEQVLAPEQKENLNYLSQIIQKARELDPPINITLPANVRRQVEHNLLETEEREQQRLETEQRNRQTGREGKSLEEQLAEAESAQDFEKAQEIKQKIDRIKRILGKSYHGTLHKGDLG